MTKPEDKTWNDYLYPGDTGGPKERRKEEFLKQMMKEVQDAIEQSQLDEGRYKVTANGFVTVRSTEAWEMEKKEHAFELRDVLREANIGDESVGVYITPRDSQGEVGELPPDHVAPDVEYGVFIRLSRIQEAIDLGASRAKSKM